MYCRKSDARKHGACEIKRREDCEKRRVERFIATRTHDELAQLSNVTKLCDLQRVSKDIILSDLRLPPVSKVCLIVAYFN